MDEVTFKNRQDLQRNRNDETGSVGESEEERVIYENLIFDIEDEDIDDELDDESEEIDEELYDEPLVIEESDSDDALNVRDFSDEEDEELEARKILRLARLERKNAIPLMITNGVGGSKMADENNCVVSQMFANNCHEQDFKFELGLKFTDLNECKQAVILWNVLNGHNIKWTKSSKERVQAECIEDCPWRLYARRYGEDPTFMITILEGDHNCERAKKNRQATSGWLADQMLNVFKSNPNIQAAQLKKDVELKFDIDITVGMCYRVKFLALQKLRGSYKEDYKKLRSYVAELKRIDSDGRFELKTQLNKKGECIFQRVYIGFSALRDGFMRGCRKLIGFDGCFLKTVLGGVLLAAVGKDCNNQIYPIAWAVVEKETTATWKWFCDILFSHFGIADGLGWSFMSDKQKGLINAILDLTPQAEHRHCSRHVYANWKKKFGGSKFEHLFWTCVKANTVAKYEEALHQLKSESVHAYDEFCIRAPKSFCKSLVRSFTKSGKINNNICESFNSFILSARDKPIVQMLEHIRKSLMVKMHNVAQSLERCEDKICPNIRKTLSKFGRQTRFCNILTSPGGKYEVALNSEVYIVDLAAKGCSCVDWNLTGIPCVHACACISRARRDVMEFLDPFYYKSTCVEAYKFGLEPIHGENEWPKITDCPIMPPYVSKRPGRPKKQRKRAADEVFKKNPNKLTKHGVRMKCSNCGRIGHNKRSCSAPKSIDSSTTGTSTTKRTKGKTTNATIQEVRKDGRNVLQTASTATTEIGSLVSDSGNVFWRASGVKRSQFVATSRDPNDRAQIRFQRGSQVRVRTMGQDVGQNDGSQVDNLTPLF